jgi:transposase-like protein
VLVKLIFVVMILDCKFCGSGNLVKNSIVFGKQRYKCKDCKKNFRDVKSKYSIEQKRSVHKIIY